MKNLYFCFNATMPIFLTMFFGYLFRKKGIMDASFVKTLNHFNFNITLPVLLFLDIYHADYRKVWDTKYVLFCFIVTFFCICVICLFSYFFFKDKNSLGEFMQASYRGSAAVLGIAFIQNIYHSATIAPLMIIGTVPLYNIAAVIILSFTQPDKHGISWSAFKNSILDILKNPIIIAIFFGITASLCNITFPVILEKTASNFAVLATPLALIGLGAGFEGKKALEKMKPTFFSTFIKLIIQPAIFLPFAAYLGFRDEKMVAILIMLGAPSTVSCYIMAKNMDHSGTLSSSIIVATTFFSSFTITFWLYLLKSYGII